MAIKNKTEARPENVKARASRPKRKLKATDAKRGGKPASRIDKANGKRR